MIDLKRHVSCIILAGGKNTRMGREKAFLRVGEKTIIEEQIERLSSFFEEVIIVTNIPGRFKSLEAKVVKDIISEAGPLGGLYAGLSVSSNVHCFLIGCDMPFPNLKLIGYMTDQIGDHDVVVPLSSRGTEALFAIYSVNCLESIRQQVGLKNLKLSAILKYHKVRYLSSEEVSRFDPLELSFFNVNSRADFKKAREIWKKE